MSDLELQARVVLLQFLLTVGDSGFQAAELYNEIKDELTRRKRP